MKDGIPRLIIPVYNDGRYVAIYRRDLRPDAEHHERWKDVAGSTKNELYLVDCLKKKRPTVLDHGTSRREPAAMKGCLVLDVQRYDWPETLWIYPLTIFSSARRSWGPKGQPSLVVSCDACFPNLWQYVPLFSTFYMTARKIHFKACLRGIPFGFEMLNDGVKPSGRNAYNIVGIGFHTRPAR